MKRKTSIILFGTSFLIAILGEAYLLNVAKPHVFSIIGIGIVVILTGYLFFDSIWEHILGNNKKKELIREEIISQEAEKWDSRYTELLNIQKATYAATKKSQVKLEEQIIEMSDKLAQIIQLQYKVMDGQKKALNISVNYSKEHSKEIIEAIIDEGKISSPKEAVGLIESDQEVNESHKEEAESEIKPLYEDSNAALNADEISKLFETYGK